jgi:hypothetical protein
MDNLNLEIARMAAAMGKEHYTLLTQTLGEMVQLKSYLSRELNF